MQIFSGEFCKIFFRKGFLLAFAALIALNGFFLIRNEMSSDYIPPQAYTELYNDLTKLSDSEKSAYLTNGQEDMECLSQIETSKQSENSELSDFSIQDKNKLAKYTELYNKGGFLKYTKYIFAEERLYGKTLEEFNRIQNYDKYLDSIKKEAEKMEQVSIFSDPYSFAYRNIEKTAQALKPLEGRTLSFDISNGVNMATNAPLSDLLALIMIIYICVCLIMKEKETGMFSLVHSSYHGHGKLIFSKIGVVAVSCLIFETAFFSTNFIIAGNMYGFGNLSRAIQSVQGYNGSFLQLNVLQYILLFLLTKYIAYIMVGLIILLMCILIKNPAVLYVSAALFIGAEYALYSLIPAFSSENFFKFINIVNFVFVTPLYSDYVNIDLFGYPANVISTAAISCIFLLILLITLSVTAFSVKKAISSTGKLSLPFLKKRLPILGASVRIFCHENFKLVIANKAWLILIALIAVQLFGYSQYSYYLSSDEYYYKQYMQSLEGPLTYEKTVFLESEQKRLDDLQNTQFKLSQQYESGKMSQNDYDAAALAISQSLQGKTAFDMVMQRYEYIKSSPSSNQLTFVYDGGYNKIFGVDDNNSLMDSLILVISLIGLFAAVFASEYSSGAVNLISTCVKGRKYTMHFKFALCLILTVPVFFICFAPEFISICKFYGLNQLFAPIASLPDFSSMPTYISILGYIVMLYSIRLLAAVISVLIILFISQLSRNTLLTIIISFGALAGPIVLSSMGLSLIDDFSLNALFLGNNLFKENALIAFVQLGIFVLLGIVAIIIIRMRFCRFRLGKG